MNKRTLSEWRKSRQLTQVELAHKVKLSLKTISTYENEGLQSATLGNINRILKALDITIEQVDLN